jgi:hypothetical protein
MSRRDAVAGPIWPPGLSSTLAPGTDRPGGGHGDGVPARYGPFVWTATADAILAKVQHGRVTLEQITNQD